MLTGLLTKSRRTATPPGAVMLCCPAHGSTTIKAAKLFAVPSRIRPCLL
jgi:hypothetical protein